MQFTKVGRFYMDLDDIAFVHDGGSDFIVVFRGGGEASLSEREASAFRIWLSDKVQAELQLPEEDEPNTNTPLNELLKDLPKYITEHDARTTEVDSAQQPTSPSDPPGDPA